MLSANSNLEASAVPASSIEAAGDPVGKIAIAGSLPEIDAIVTHATEYAENLLTLMLAGESLPVVEVLASIWLLNQTILACGKYGMDSLLQGSYGVSCVCAYMFAK